MWTWEQVELAANTDEPTAAHNQRRRKQVFDALGQLPYEQREVFVLHVQARYDLSADCRTGWGFNQHGAKQISLRDGKIKVPFEYRVRK